MGVLLLDEKGRTGWPAETIAKGIVVGRSQYRDVVLTATHATDFCNSLCG